MTERPIPTLADLEAMPAGELLALMEDTARDVFTNLGAFATAAVEQLVDAIVEVEIDRLVERLEAGGDP